MNVPGIFLRNPDIPSAPAIPLSQGITLLGRNTECHVCIADVSISRFHAELSLEGDVLQVRDLGSRNGTYVDGAAG